MDLGSILSMFRLLAPEFDDVSNADVRVAVAMACDLVSEKRFGRFYGRAVVLMTAHQLKIARMAQEDAETGNDHLTTGNVTSEREGDLQRSYSTVGVTGGDEDYLLQKTVYGRQFLALRKRCIVPVVVRKRGARWRL